AIPRPPGIAETPPLRPECSGFVKRQNSPSAPARVHKILSNVNHNKFHGILHYFLSFNASINDFRSSPLFTIPAHIFHLRPRPQPQTPTPLAQTDLPDRSWNPPPKDAQERPDSWRPGP